MISGEKKYQEGNGELRFALKTGISKGEKEVLP